MGTIIIFIEHKQVKMDKNDKDIDIDFNLTNPEKIEEIKEKEGPKQKEDEGWFSWGFNQIKSATQTAYNTVTDDDFQQKVKEGAITAFDKTKDGVNYVKEKVTDPNLQDSLKEGISDGWNYTKDGVKKGWEKVNDAEWQQNAKETLVNIGEKTKDVAIGTYTMGKEVIKDLSKKDN